METKANHMLIGSVVIIAFLGILGFIMWIIKLDIDQEFSRYDIFFNQSVAGLSKASDVRYNGIVVGEVKDIEIAAHDPGKVRVLISIDSKTPITDESVASIEFYGFTGVAYVLIEGGSPTGKILKKTAEQAHPVIQSKASSLQELFTDVPTLIAEASITLSQVRLLLSEENRTYITGILKSAETISNGLAGRTERMQSILDNVDKSLTEFNQAVQSYQTLADSTNDLVQSDVKGLVTDLRQTTASFNKLSTELNGVVQSNSGSINAFTTNTLPEVSLLISEVRDLAASLRRVSEKIENNPTEFLFGGKQPEYEPK